MAFWHAIFGTAQQRRLARYARVDIVADAADNEAVWDALMVRLGAIQEYRDLFAAAYPNVADWDDFNFGHAARAIAAFERRSWTALDSRFDRYLAGDDSALSTTDLSVAFLQ